MSTSTISINSLAADSLAYIFSLLPPNERVRQERVCRKWGKIARKYSWTESKTLTLKRDELAQQGEKALAKYQSLLVRYGPHLRLLSIPKCDRTDELLQLAAFCCPRLAILLLPIDWFATEASLTALIRFENLFYLRLFFNMSRVDVFGNTLEKIGAQLRALSLRSADHEMFTTTAVTAFELIFTLFIYICYFLLSMQFGKESWSDRLSTLLSAAAVFLCANTGPQFCMRWLCGKFGALTSRNLTLTKYGILSCLFLLILGFALTHQQHANLCIASISLVNVLSTGFKEILPALQLWLFKRRWAKITEDALNQWREHWTMNRGVDQAEMQEWQTAEQRLAATQGIRPDIMLHIVHNVLVHQQQDTSTVITNYNCLLICTDRIVLLQYSERTQDYIPGQIALRFSEQTLQITRGSTLDDFSGGKMRISSGNPPTVYLVELLSLGEIMEVMMNCNTSFQFGEDAFYDALENVEEETPL